MERRAKSTLATTITTLPSRMWHKGVAAYAAGNRHSAKEDPSVRGSARDELRRFFGPSGVVDSSFKATFPQRDFSLGQATEEVSPLMAKIIERWTLMEDSNIFTQILPPEYTNNTRIQYVSSP